MCPPFDDPPGFGEDRAEKLLNQAGDGDAMKDFVVSDADLDEVSGDVVALVVFHTADGTAEEKHAELEREFEDVVASVQPLDEETEPRAAVSCRGSAERVRDLVASLRNAPAVSDVTVTLLRGS